jgi:hypothetical protein
LPTGGFLPEDRILVEREKGIDPNLLVLREAPTSSIRDGFTEGWVKIGKALFSKSLNGKTAMIQQAAPGRWIIRLANRRGQVKIGPEIPVSGADLVSVITMADKFLNFGSQILPKTPKQKRQSSNITEFPREPGGQKVEIQTERAGLKILMDRIIGKGTLAPPVPTPTPAPEPTPDTVPAPVDRSIQYMAEENRSDSIYAQAFHAARHAIEPLKIDLRNMAAGRPQDVPGSDRVSMVNRSIIENGGITVDGKVSPAVAARRFLGLPLPEQASQSFVDRSGRKGIGATDPAASHTNISYLVRRSLGLQGSGRPKDQRSIFHSKRIPDLVFRTRQARDHYDGQISANVHDGKVAY